MSATLSFLIRDGLATDVLGCLSLDHSYETEYVWQMQINHENGWRIDFKNEHLPRAVDATYEVDGNQLQSVLAPHHCFLVATTRDDEPELLGYLAMRSDPIDKLGLVRNLVVARPYRRRQIASRLLKIAALWAREHQLTNLMIETQTKNYPGIRFCESAGFTFCGFNDHYFPNRDIAVFFSQSIR